MFSLGKIGWDAIFWELIWSMLKITEDDQLVGSLSKCDNLGVLDLGVQSQCEIS